VELRPKRAFYDYKSKYTKGMTEYLVPAPIPADLTRSLQRLALRAHGVLGLRDFSRVDIKLDGQGKPYVLEVNNIPGFTELSLLPKAARAAGISFEAVCARLVSEALARRNGHGKQ
jgi:D-alanine-D-alanine ligase